MKTQQVGNISETCERIARRGVARNYGHTIYSERVGARTVAYSYGNHWTLAVIDEDGIAWMNPGRYSRTTAKHRNILARAIRAEGHEIAWVDNAEQVAGGAKPKLSNEARKKAMRVNYI